jgi:hypothetical protein
MLFRPIATRYCFALLFLIVLSPKSCQRDANRQSADPATNVVAEYFSHADRQYETDDQKSEIIRALQDMLEKPVGELRTQRYADYEGNKNAWPITTLVKRYFVPNQPMPELTEQDFYRDVKEPAAQEAIRKQLGALEKEAPAH